MISSKYPFKITLRNFNCRSSLYGMNSFDISVTYETPSDLTKLQSIPSKEVPDMQPRAIYSI